MVEGPGCTLNGEKIRSRVQPGQKVKELRSLTTTKINDPNKGSFQILTGCQYTGVATLGKELFLYFGERALRVHFGMNGSMRINPAQTQAQTQGRMRPSPMLEIHLTRDIICLFDSTAEIRLTADCEGRVQTMHTLDVCSPRFSSSRAAEVVRGQRDRMLCDVLLDQTILPGVGNIIKNEALFDSGLHPAVKVADMWLLCNLADAYRPLIYLRLKYYSSMWIRSLVHFRYALLISQLTDEQVHHLVKMTRDFTLLFYKCRKSGSSLQKHYKVYKRPRCGQCPNSITVCRLGDNGRMTYFCRRCQSADPGEVDLSKLPARNSLLDWAYRASVEPSDHVVRREEQEWTCGLCTLINQPALRTCEACLSPRTQVPADELSSIEKAVFTRDLIKYPCIAFSKPREELKVNCKAAFGSTTLVFTDLSEKSNEANPLFSPASSHLNSLAGERGLNKHNVCQGTTSPNYASGGWQNKSTELSKGGLLASYSQPSKKMRIDHSPFPGSKAHDVARCVSSSKTTASNEKTQEVPTIPCCTSHQCPSVLRVVNKDGDNKGRQFYTCSLPRDQRCNFFEWADLHFPLCNHGKRCLKRTVLKLGPNNGRNFYACSFLMGKQCDYFQWA